MSEPVCGHCYEASLPEYQRNRPGRGVVGSIWLCESHQAAQDAFMARFAHLINAASPASKDSMSKILPFERGA